MSYYDTMQVCERWGHKITDMYDSSPEFRQDFCEKCGASTVHKCSHCNTKIKGYYHIEGVIGGGGARVPLNCHKCGNPYPWRQKLLIKRTASATIAPLKYIIDSIIGLFKK